MSLSVYQLYDMLPTMSKTDVLLDRCPRGVWLLGAVSLLNDVASEAIYPLLPFFLTTVLGATAVSLGRHRRRCRGGQQRPESHFRQAVRSMAAAKADCHMRVRALGGRAPVHQPGGLVVDGLCAAFHRSRGKGIRGAPRDAMLADFADHDQSRKGVRLSSGDGSHGCDRRTVAGDGLSRSRYPNRYRTLFALTAIPGVATVVLLMVGERNANQPATRVQTPIPQSPIPNP